MAKLSLKDVAELSDNLEREELISNTDMQEYIVEMQEVGAEVLKQLSGDELAVAISFMQAMFSYQLIEDNPMLAMVFLSKPESTSVAMMQALKFAVGISLSEDWR
jgi:hypothetical protein